MFVLMCKDTPYEWNAAFHKLKQALSKDPVLVTLKTDLPFILDTDTSNTGHGDVLSQMTPESERLLLTTVVPWISRENLSCARNCWQ